MEDHRDTTQNGHFFPCPSTKICFKQSAVPFSPAVIQPNYLLHLHNSPPYCPFTRSTLPNLSAVLKHSDATGRGLPVLLPEYLAFTAGKVVPFGYNPNFDSDTLYPPTGDACTRFSDELWKFMGYDVNGSCPDDELLAQKLLLKGCEPLPRRRCRPAAPMEYRELYPFPACLWAIPSEDSVVWTAYTCKSYGCLVNRRRRQKGFGDCKDCFDLEGEEKVRWTGEDSHRGLNFSIDEVLATKKPGTIRIGLNIDGGVATFAVRMMERNLTMVTTSLNLNGPFNSFIASRGVVTLYISISQHLPFFDNTLDIVHSMHVMSNWITTALLHFLMFDVYRVLRPGRLFWLNHFFCSGDKLETVYAPQIESVRFNKLKLVIGRKLDHGPELREIYLSALVVKPLKNSWRFRSVVSKLSSMYSFRIHERIVLKATKETV